MKKRVVARHGIHALRTGRVALTAAVARNLNVRCMQKIQRRIA